MANKNPPEKLNDGRVSLRLKEDEEKLLFALKKALSNELPIDVNVNQTFIVALKALAEKMGVRV